MPTRDHPSYLGDTVCPIRACRSPVAESLLSLIRSRAHAGTGQSARPLALAPESRRLRNRTAAFDEEALIE